MVCEKVIGKLKDVDITGKTVEYVDIELLQDQDNDLIYIDILIGTMDAFA